jgi:putative glutamine amidotransferase
MKNSILIAAPESARSKYGNYTAALERAGLTALFAPGGSKHLPDCAALLLPGGADLAPRYYRQPNCGSRNIDDSLDSLQFALMSRFAALRKPVLGICKGAQVINVFFDGTLIQDLPSDLTAIHAQKDGSDRTHYAQAEPSSFLSEIYNSPQIKVNSAHHQAIDALGTSLRAVQYASDGTIEAVQHASLPVYGVQWHPERLPITGNALFDWFSILVSR